MSEKLSPNELDQLMRLSSSTLETIKKTPKTSLYQISSVDSPDIFRTIKTLPSSVSSKVQKPVSFTEQEITNFRNSIKADALASFSPSIVKSLTEKDSNVKNIIESTYSKKLDSILDQSFQKLLKPGTKEYFFSSDEIAQQITEDITAETKAFTIDTFNEFSLNVFQSGQDVFKFYFSSLVGSMLGSAFGPFRIIENFSRQYWDPMIQQISESVVEGRMFFENISDIPKNISSGGFGDTLKGVLPGTLYQRPLQKHPLLPSESDVHRVSRSDASAKQPGGMKYAYDQKRDELLNDPPMSFDPTYPYEHFFETESGHAFEYDDTPSFERIQLKHRSGTGFHVNPDGSQKLTIVGSNYTVVLENHKLRVHGDIETYVDGNAKISVNGSVQLNAGQDLDLSVGRNLTLDVKDTFKVRAKSISLNARTPSDDNDATSPGGRITLNSEKNIDLSSGENLTYDVKDTYKVRSKTIDLNAKGGYLQMKYDTMLPFTPLESPNVQQPETSEVKELHPAKEYRGYEFQNRYEGIETSGSRISTASIQDGINRGSLERSEVAERMPDAIVPTESDDSYTPQPRSSSGGGWSSPAPKNPSNPRDSGYHQKISDHFYLSDLCLSPLVSKNKFLRAQCGFSLQGIVDRLAFLAQTCLDPLYEMYGGCSFTSYGRKSGRLKITSAFRKDGCSSWHTKGSAVDIQLDGVSKGNYYHEAIKIRDAIPGFDAILLEYKTTDSKMPWIHLQARPEMARGNCQTFMNHRLYANKFVNLESRAKN
jgi:hypothetical protein